MWPLASEIHLTTGQGKVFNKVFCEQSSEVNLRFFKHPSNSNDDWRTSPFVVYWRDGSRSLLKAAAEDPTVARALFQCAGPLAAAEYRPHSSSEAPVQLAEAHTCSSDVHCNIVILVRRLRRLSLGLELTFLSRSRFTPTICPRPRSTRSIAKRTLTRRPNPPTPAKVLVLLNPLRTERVSPPRMQKVSTAFGSFGKPIDDFLRPPNTAAIEFPMSVGLLANNVLDDHFAIDFFVHHTTRLDTGWRNNNYNRRVLSQAGGSLIKKLPAPVRADRPVAVVQSETFAYAEQVRE